MTKTKRIEPTRILCGAGYFAGLHPGEIVGINLATLLLSHVDKTGIFTLSEPPIGRHFLSGRIATVFYDVPSPASSKPTERRGITFEAYERLGRPTALTHELYAQREQPITP